MQRSDLTEKILDIKRERGWTWKFITDEIGGISGKTVFAAVGPNSLSVSKLAALAKLAKRL